MTSDNNTKTGKSQAKHVAPTNGGNNSSGKVTILARTSDKTIDTTNESGQSAKRKPSKLLPQQQQHIYIYRNNNIQQQQQQPVNVMLWRESGVLKPRRWCPGSRRNALGPTRQFPHGGPGGCGCQQIPARIFTSAMSCSQPTLELEAFAIGIWSEDHRTPPTATSARRPPPQATSESAFEQKPWQPVCELFFHDLAKRRCKLGNRVTTRWRFQLHIWSHVETPGLSSTTSAETFCQCC